MWLWFIFGCFCGGLLVVLVLALCAAAGWEDDTDGK